MKRFCILEQGKYVNHNITLKKKEMFNSDISDFYRFNWFTDDDPNANWTPKDCNNERVRFSEGRNLLYDKVNRDNYEYFIFMDEDIVIKTYPDNSENADVILDIIDKFLTGWDPICGLIHTTNMWGKNQRLMDEMKRTGKPICVRRHDACVGIMKKTFANLVYPIIQHGSDLVTIYQQWIVKSLAPEKFMAVPNLHSINSFEEQHYHVDDRKSTWWNKIATDLEVGITDKSKSYLNYLKSKDVVSETEFNLQPSNKNINITIDDLNKIFDVNHLNFKNTRKYIK
jgi:hypothetical protein